MQKIFDVIESRENKREFAAIKKNEEVAENEYLLMPSRYIEFCEREQTHRSFKEIADNINYISRMQNACKLVINETIAKGLANIAFKGIRKLNRTEIPKKVNEIKELLSPLGIAAKKISAKTSKGMGAKAGANMLYGGVEDNDYQ